MSKTPAQIAEEIEQFSKDAAQVAENAAQFAKETEQFAEETAKNRLEHLKFIQAVIARMAGNSFQLKAWSVTLVSAILALIAKDGHAWYVIITWLPILVFWRLDAYYLRQERLFRKLYGEVAKGKIGSAEYTLDTAPFGEEAEPIKAVMGSVTLKWFYGVLFAVSLIFLFLLSGGLHLVFEFIVKLIADIASVNPS